MEALREYRYTIPGVAFGLLMFVAFGDHLSNLDGGISKGMVLLSGALVAFAFGYPFATMVGIVTGLWPPLMNRMTIPLPPPTTRKKIQDHFDSSDDDETRGCISVMHHTMLEPAGLAFLARRLNAFYVDVNTSVALVVGMLISAALGKSPSCCICLGVALAVVVLGCHAYQQVREHRRLCSRLYPVLFDKMNRLGSAGSQNPNV